MIFRFKIQEVNGSSSSDGTATINYLDLAVKLIINNITVIDEVNVSSFTGWTGNLTIKTGIVLTKISLINDTFKLEFDFDSLSNFIDCQLIISKDNYLSYQNSFNLYGYDIGNNEDELNNQGLPINTNPKFDVILIPVEYKDNPYMYFTIIQIPFTNNYLIYNLSSSDGIVHYYRNDKLISGVSNAFTCIKDDSFTIVGKNLLLTEIDTYTFFYTKKLNKPDFFIKNECLDCIGSCTSIFNNPKSIIELFDNTKTIYINDEISIGYENVTIIWSLYGISGEALTSTSYDIESLKNINLFNSQLYGFNYSIPFKGDYIIEAKIRFNKQFECIKTVNIKGCNVIEIDTDDVCNSIKFKNLSNSNIVVNLRKFNINTKDFTNFITTFNYTAFSINEIGTMSDGLYQFEVIRNNSSEFYIVPIYCNLLNCYKDYLHEIITNIDTNLTEQVQYKFNVFSMLYNSYFFILNKYEYFKNEVSTLPESLNLDLVLLQSIEDSLYKYCKNCQPQIINNCGCG